MFILVYLLELSKMFDTTFHISFKMLYSLNFYQSLFQDYARLLKDEKNQVLIMQYYAIII